MSLTQRLRLLCIAYLFFIGVSSFSQTRDCIDLGTGIGVSNGEIALIDFFKNGGTWEVVGNNGHPWYKVNNLDSFKVVNGAYYNWDIDWSGTVNNEAWGNDWADCFISYWDMMVDQGRIRPDGYPTGFPTTVYKYRPKSIDPNQNSNPASPVQITEFSRRIYFPPGLPLEGWVLKWKGRGSIRYEGIEVTSSNVTSFDQGESWRPDASAPYAGRNYIFDSRTSTTGGRVICEKYWMVHGYVLNILESDPADPIRDIVFLYPGLEDEFDAGQRFNPLFLERMQQFRCLRYMGYLNSNGIESRRVMAEDHPYNNTWMLERLRWNERTPDNYYVINNGNGGNYETIIDLANQTHTDPWVNIPYCAGQPYVDSMVQLFMERLDPDLTLYMEVGNEMWNFAPGFSGFFWQARLRVREYPGLGDVEARGVFINEMFQQVTETAGTRNLPRIVRVFGAFPRYYDVNNRTLSMVDPNNWDAFATTWYFQLSEDNSSSNECRDTQSNTNWRSVLYNWFLAHPNDQEGFNNMYRDCMLNEFRCEGGYRNNVDIQLANYHNKRVVCYEGGNHTFYGCENGPTGAQLPGELDFDTPVYPNYFSDNAFINRVCVADESAAMGDVFNEVVDSLQSAGIVLANHLSFAGRSTCYGVWDLMQDRDITAPLATLLARYSKFRVFSERIDAENCFEQNIELEGDTVGAGLSIMTDGFNDYIEGETTYIPDETTNYTLEAWFKPDLMGAEQVMISFSATGANDYYNVVKIRDDNRVVWEIGNNGSFVVKLIGPVVQADLWNHVAVVKNANRYTLYLNGVNVASGNYTLPQYTRNRFTMGALYRGSSGVNYYDGELDEVRLWNVARTQDEIRDFMCKKVPRSYSQFGSLRAYYKFDYPDYVNSGLYDYTSRTINGYLRNITISERSRYAVSGAAIGDYSRNIYPASWNGVSVSITHPQGDRFAAYNFAGGTPAGVHVYMFDGAPHYNEIPQYYDDISDNHMMGVFVANGASTNYDLTYVYSGNPDAGTSGGEEDLRLLRRDDASVEDWLHAGAVLDLTANSLTVSCKESCRAEYNIGHRPTINQVRPGAGRALLDTQTPTGDIQGLVQYLDFSDFTATFWARGWGEVFRLTSQLDANSCNFTLNADNTNTWCGVRYGRHWDYDVTFNVSGMIGNVNEWHHYAITKSGSAFRIYVDGMERASGNVTVQFPFQEIHLCNAPAWQAGNYPGRHANLSLDEFTLWDIALDQTTIRDWMCKKINEDHPYQCENLLVYFNFDEGQGSVLEDRRGPSDAVFTSGYQWIYSGAAIGDESTYDYVSPDNIGFPHPDGDYLEAARTGGTSNGIHLYRVDDMPPESTTTSSTSIQSIDSSRYWGMFVVKTATATPTYNVINHYQNNTQVNLSRETELRMPSRTNNSISPWTANNTITPNIAQHTLTLTNQLRGEYILGGTSTETFNDYLPPVTPVFVPQNDTTNIDTLCGNSTGLVYRVEPDPYATSYIWIVPAELEGFSTSDSIILNSTYAGTLPVDVTLAVIAINAYGESDTASYAIHIVPRPTVADAGPDQIILPPLTGATMDGNIPLITELATWYRTLGGGNITDIHDPLTTVTTLPAGSNHFAWDIDNSICPVSSDTVYLLLAPPPIDIIQQNGEPLPRIVCQGDVLLIRAVPHEDITPDAYFWQLPNGMTLVAQNGSDATIQIGSGIGGTIEVSAMYSGQNSEPYSSDPISINALPNAPVFLEAPANLCRNVNAMVSINYDATIDSVEWILPYGIYPVDYPKSVSESIVIEALDIMSGYIAARVYNDGCSAGTSIDSFAVSVSEAPETPELYLGTNGGTADAVCANSDFILWVRNVDPNAMYEWQWNADLTFVEYLNDNHSGARFHIIDQNSPVLVRAVVGTGACNTSEWFEFYAWPQPHGPATITTLSITNPVGQNPMVLVVGQTYTFTVTGNGDLYYWDVPAGFQLIDDGNINDEVNRIRVVTAGAGYLDVYPITERGCAGDAFRINIGTSGSLLPPEYLSGSTTFCQGAIPNITVTSITGATEYVWTLPDGTVIITNTNVLNQSVNTPMNGIMTVVARNSSTQSTPTEISIIVSPTFLSHAVFVDDENTPLTEIEICNGDYYKQILVNNNLASSHIWDIHGSAIQFEPRYEPGHDGDNDYELTNRTSVVDTMMPVSWVGWRCRNDGADGGYIIVTSVNGCGGPNVRDSIPYIWHQTLGELIPEFINAPEDVCVGSMVNYEVAAIPNATEYIWQLPNGLFSTEIVTPTPSITVNIVNGTGGPVGVMARGSYCGSSQTAQQLSNPVRISGDAIDFHFIDEPLAACPGDVLTYSVNDIGAGVYNWTLPEALRSSIKDDDDVTGIIITGSWNRELRNNMINGEYRSIYNNNAANNIRYTPDLPYTGSYRVSISYFGQWDGRQDVPVTVYAQNGTFLYNINMNAPPADGIWQTLGEFDFNQGTAGYVTIGSQASGGSMTFADAVRFEILSFPDDTTITVPAQTGQGGAVCVSANVPQCASDYTICTDPINVGNTLETPMFSLQETSVCEGMTYTYRITDIGADTYTWILPAGMNIGGQTGIITGLGREETVDMVTNTGMPVRIGVLGVIGSCGILSDTVFTNDIEFNGLGCVLSDPEFTSEPPSICLGNTATYTIALVQFAEEYVWTIPAGLRQVTTNATGTIVTTIPTIVVEPTGTPTGTLGYITVFARSSTIPQSSVVTTTTTVSVIPSPVYSLTANNISQCGMTDGIINISGLTASSLYTITYNNGGNLVGPINNTSNTSGEIEVTNLTAGSYYGFNVDRNGCASSNNTTLTINAPTAPIITDIDYNSPLVCGGSGTVILSLNNAVNGDIYYVDYNNDGVNNDTGTVAANAITLSNVPTITVLDEVLIINSVTNCLATSIDTGRIIDPTPVVVNTIQFNNPVQCGGTGSIAITLAGASEGDIYDVDFENNGSNDASGTVSAGILTISGIATNTSITDLFLTNRNTLCRIDNGSTWLFEDPLPAIISGVDLISPDQCGGTGSIRIALDGAINNTVYTIDLDNNGVADATQSVINDTIELINQPVGTIAARLSVQSSVTNCVSTSNYSGSITPAYTPVITGIELIDPDTCGEDGSIYIFISSAINGELFDIDLNNDNITDASGGSLNDTLFIDNILTSQVISNVSITNNTTLCEAGSTFSDTFRSSTPVVITAIDFEDALLCGETGNIVITLSDALQDDVYSIDYEDDGSIDYVGTVNNDTISIPDVVPVTYVSNLALINNVTHCISHTSIIGSVNEPPSTVIDDVVITDPTTCGGTGSVSIMITSATGGGTYDIDYTNDMVYDVASMASMGNLLLDGLPNNTIISNIHIRNQSTLCESDFAIEDTLIGPLPLDLGATEVQNPVYCDSAGSFTVAVSNGIEGTSYNIDFNNDGGVDQYGVITGTELLVNNIAPGTAINGFSVTNPTTLCTSFSDVTITIIPMTPPVITAVLFESPFDCGVDGMIRIALADGIDGDIYQVNIDEDAVYEFTGTVTDDTINTPGIPPGTNITAIGILNPASLCQANVIAAGLIADPSPYDITAVDFINPTRCDGTGIIRIALTGSDPEGEVVFNIDLNSDGNIDGVDTINTGYLELGGIAIGTQVNGLTITDAITNCQAISQETGTIMSPPLPAVSLEIPATYCLGDDITLSGGIPEGGIYSIDGVIYNNLQTEIIGNGTFRVLYTYTDANNCTNTATDSLIINGLPIAEISGPLSICPGAVSVLYETTENTDFQYIWNVINGAFTQGTGENEILVNWTEEESGAVLLITTDNNTGCTDTTQADILLSDITFPQFIECLTEYPVEAEMENSLPTYALQVSDSIVIPSATDDCQGNLVYTFSFNNGESVNVNDMVGYILASNTEDNLVWTVTDASGNSATCTTHIVFEFRKIAPTAFSPDGVPPNDTWEIDFLVNYPECVVSVYNRWGMLVYQSERGYPVPWDGMDGDKLVPVDSYYFIIDLGDGSKPYKGYVSVMY